MKALVLAHAVATFVMLGVILVIQVVHYPLFARVGADGFVAYEQAHTRLITLVVMPPMVVELLTGAALVLQRPAGVPAWLSGLGLALVLVIWVSTAFVQVPAHGALSAGFDAAAHQKLVSTNWIRTVAWLARAAVVTGMLYGMLGAQSPSQPATIDASTSAVPE